MCMSLPVTLMWLIYMLWKIINHVVTIRDFRIQRQERCIYASFLSNGNKVQTPKHIKLLEKMICFRFIGN